MKHLRPPALTPTAEQLHILDLIRSTSANLIINAGPGTGKTATLDLIQQALQPPVLCLAFNRRIAEKMRKEFLSTTMVKTFNGLGHSAWAPVAGLKANELVVNDKKSLDHLRSIIGTFPRSERNEAYEIFYEVATAIGLAKSFGYVPEGRYPNASRLIEAQEFYAKLDEVPSDLFTELLEEALHRSIQAAYAGAIDYNDQCYMPAVFGGTFPRFPTVLVDEAQDINPCNLAMLVHLAPHSRICAVGDPWQGIYGFRGAMQGAMGRLQEQFEMTPADLTVSFRCPEAVVRNAQWRNPTLRWLKPGGRVAKLRSPNPTDFADGAAVICRNNAPLFAMAMHLLAHGRSVSVAGSDVGPKVIGIMRKLGPETLTKEQLNGAIDEWLTEKLSKDSKTATDIADCMRVFASLGRTLEEAIGYAQHLFEQSGTLTLLTGHKAKGLEWPVVYHLDPWLIGESEQELNLLYVIQTRALETYYEIESREIRWSR